MNLKMKSENNVYTKSRIKNNHFSQIALEVPLIVYKLNIFRTPRDIFGNVVLLSDASE